MDTREKLTEELIEDTATLIAEYNPQLADAWRSKPFKRVDLAYAFARGFVKNEEDDINPIASIVIQASLLDQQVRKIEMEAEEQL